MAYAYLRAVRSALRTTTGTQDFTFSGFGTVVGFMVFLTRATADDTVAAEAATSIGLCDMTRQRCCAQKSRNNVATTSNHRAALNDKVAALIKPDGSGYDVEVAFSSSITDGVRLNVATTDGVAYLCTVILFGGPDMQVYVDTVDLASGAANSTTDITSVGFQSNFIFALGANLDFAGSSPAPTANEHYSFGVACDSASGIELARDSYGHTDGRLTTEPSLNTPGTLATSFHNISTSTGATTMTNTASVGVSAFLSNGFRAVNINGVDPPQFAIMAVRVGAQCDLVRFNTPTSGGGTNSLSMTTPGSAFSFNTEVSAIGNVTNTNAGQYGVGFASMSEQFCFARHERNGVALTDNGCVSDDRIINIPSGDGSATDLAGTASFSDTGLTITYGTVLGTARNHDVLLIPRGVVTGTGAGSFPLATGTGAGSLTFEGTGAGSFPVPTGTGTGSEVFVGTGAGSFAPPTGTGSGEEAFPGTGAGSFPLPSGTGSGSLTFSGTGAGTMPLPTGAGSGEEVFEAAGAGLFPLPQGTGSGSLVFSGSGDGSFPVPRGSGNGSSGDELEGCVVDLAASRESVIDLPASHRRTVSFSASYHRRADLRGAAC